jgi:biopolymer transport protein TolQ
MDPKIVEATQIAPPAGMAAHDFSVVGLFMQADIVVKAIMIGLMLWSIWSLAIMFEKWFRLRSLNARADKFEDAFWSGGSLDTLYERVSKKVRDPMVATFVAGMREWKLANDRAGARSPSAPLRGNLQERVDRVMAVTIGREMAQVERYMNVLATAGSTATFVGLAGTVYGIMSSFTSIAAEQNTSLAVVAPGIAEALLSTLLGLVVAIPAVMAYNKFASDIGRYGERLDAFSAEFSAILSRYLEGKE